MCYSALTFDVVMHSTVGLMSAVTAANWSRRLRPTEDNVNLFLLPTMTPSDTAYGSNAESGMLVVIQ